jgi:molecular chaperone DnaJ
MDFYALLGIDSTATTAEIKRAYRRLSRRYHPGLNPGDRTVEAFFQQISEAYETLVDPQRRSTYDANGSRSRGETRSVQTFEFSGFDFSVRAQGAQAATFTELFADVLHPTHLGTTPEHGADLHATLTVSFLEAMQGTRRQVVVTRQDICGACRGRGVVSTAEGRCAECHATGKVRWARGHMVFSKPCGACSGTGKRHQQRCDVCAGHARVVRSEAVSVDVPAGTADRAGLRIAGKGHAGRNGGRTGDLYVVVHVQPHEFFQRDGDDLFVRVPLAVHEAVLGTRIEIPSLDGPIKLRVPPGTQAGHRFRFKGRGVPTPSGGRGDLIVEVTLVLPPMVDERSKELMREFGRLNNGDVRRNLIV